MNRALTNALLVFLAGSSYGFIVPAIKLAMGFGIYPADFLPMQYMVALVLCMAYVLIRRIRFCSFLSCVKMAFLGVCTGLTSICYYTSVSLLPSAVALTLLFQYVWVSVLIECAVERHLPSGSTVIAIAIVLLGTLLAAGVFEESVSYLDPVGVAFGAGSAVFYAMFLYLSGRIETDQPAALRAAMLPIGGLVVTSIANPACYVTAFTDLNLWPFAVIMSVIGVVLPTTLINYASPKLTPGMVSIMASSELPVGVIAAWAIAGDVPTGMALIGSGLVLVGILIKQVPALINREDRKEEKSVACMQHTSDK